MIVRTAFSHKLSNANKHKFKKIWNLCFLFVMYNFWIGDFWMKFQKMPACRKMSHNTDVTSFGNEHLMLWFIDCTSSRSSNFDIVRPRQCDALINEA